MASLARVNSADSDEDVDEEEEYEYESESDDDDDEQDSVKKQLTQPPFTLYTSKESLTQLRDAMITRVQDILCCSRDFALRFLESNHFSNAGGDGEKMLAFAAKNRKDVIVSASCLVCGYGENHEDETNGQQEGEEKTTPAEPAEPAEPGLIPPRVQRKGRKKGMSAVNKELRSLKKSGAILHADAPWELTFDHSHPHDSMVFIHRPRPGTLWEGAAYRFRIVCGAEYPTRAASVTCEDAAICLHPNVDPSSGKVCLTRLLADWSPTTQLYDIMLRITELFFDAQASWGSSLNKEASAYHEKGSEVFKKRVQSLLASVTTATTSKDVSNAATTDATDADATTTDADAHDKEEEKDATTTHDKEEAVQRELVSMSEQCGHTFCVPCWEDFLNEQIRLDGVNVLHRENCPMPDCNELLPDSIKERFGGETYSKHEISIHFVNQMVDCGRLVRCPRKGCNVTSSALSSSQMISCTCGHTYCFGCSFEKHSPATCNEMKDWEARRTSEDATELFMSSFVKPCPKCGERWAKSPDCNHVICLKCSTHWCFLCGGIHPFGGVTATYYKCNRYEEKKEKKQKKGLRTTSVIARDDLRLYGHCLDGFNNAMDLVTETPQLVAKAICKYNGSSTMKIGAREQMRLEQCVDILLSARRALAHSYVCFYSHKRGVSTFAKKVVGLDEWAPASCQLFEDLQENLEAECEEISITLTTMTTPYASEDRPDDPSFNVDDDFPDIHAQSGEFSKEGGKKKVNEVSALDEIARHRQALTTERISEFLLSITRRCRILDQRREHLVAACQGELASVESVQEGETKLGGVVDKEEDRDANKMVASFMWSESANNWTPFTPEISAKLERRYQKIQEGTTEGRNHVNIHRCVSCHFFLLFLSSFFLVFFLALTAINFFSSCPYLCLLLCLFFYLFLLQWYSKVSDFPWF